MFVIKNKFIFLTFSSALVVASIVAIIVFGLNFGIDFKGGSILEVSYPDKRPAVNEIKARTDNLPIDGISIRAIGDSGYIVRSRFLNEEERVALVNALSLNGSAKLIEDRFNSIGPSIGDELKRKAYIAIAVVIAAIILFITFAFRKVSKPVSSWKYGLSAVIALIHDILIPTGIFAVLGKFAGVEIDILFITALLAILGYSVNDTIVVFDRVRENLRLNQQFHIHKNFEDIVGESIRQTMIRSINTSLTVLLTLSALFLFGGVSIHNFVLVLIIGIISGTYSSIFLASPILVLFNKFKNQAV